MKQPEQMTHPTELEDWRPFKAPLPLRAFYPTPDQG